MAVWVSGPRSAIECRALQVIAGGARVDILHRGDEPPAGFLLSDDRHQPKPLRPVGVIDISVAFRLPTEMHQCDVRTYESGARFEYSIESVAEAPGQQPCVDFSKSARPCNRDQSNGDEIDVLRHDLSELVTVVFIECIGERLEGAAALACSSSFVWPLAVATKIVINVHGKLQVSFIRLLQRFSLVVHSTRAMLTGIKGDSR